ncbi:MAG: metallophosphoesterase family protein [Myxococcota bacterium]
MTPPRLHPTEQRLLLPPDTRRLVVLGDPHGDHRGVRAVLRAEAQPHTQVVCVGDVIGYSTGRASSAVCALLKAEAIPTVEGNHEAWLRPYGELFMGCSDSSDRHLTQEAQAWVAALPHQIRIVSAEGSCVALLLHAIRDPYWDWINTTNADLLAAHLDWPPLVLAGHSHRPKYLWATAQGQVTHTPFDFVRHERCSQPLPDRGSLIVDAGSIGRPDAAELDLDPTLRDTFWGAQYGTYAVIDLHRRCATLRRLHKVPLG